MTRLRAGIVGPGGIAARHASAIAGLPGQLELVACCSRDFDRASLFTERYSGTAYDDFDRMLQEAALDLRIVTLPPFARRGEVERAAKAGVHLLVEKPIALDQRDAAQIVNAVDGTGVVAAVGFMYRFGDAIEQWRAADPGIAALFAGAYHCNSLHAPWWRSEATSGGQIVEQLIHQIDLIRHLMGEPDSVFGRRANLFHRNIDGYDAEDLSAIIFGWDDGRIATLNASNIATPGKWQKEWTIFAERSTGRFADWNNASFTSTSDSGEVREVKSNRDVFVAQLDDVASAIRGRRQPFVPLAEGAASLRLALAARQSADERREIRLTDAP